MGAVGERIRIAALERVEHLGAAIAGRSRHRGDAGVRRGRALAAMRKPAIGDGAHALPLDPVDPRERRGLAPARLSTRSAIAFVGAAKRISTPSPSLPLSRSGRKLRASAPNRRPEPDALHQSAHADQFGDVAISANGSASAS